MLKLSAVFYILAIYVFRFVMYCTVANVGSPGIVSVIRLFSLYSYTLVYFEALTRIDRVSKQIL